MATPGTATPPSSSSPSPSTAMPNTPGSRLATSMDESLSPSATTATAAPIAPHSPTTIESPSTSASASASTSASASVSPSSGTSTFLPKDEELQGFVDAVVEGRTSLAHTVDPSEITEMNIKLGAGACGAVFKATYKGRTVAVKWFSPTSLSFDENEIKSEAALMSVLDHPNLVSYVGACFKPGSFFIITELYPANLQAVIDNKSLELPLAAVLRISMGIANGMRFLHSLGLVHRDLKSPNILLTYDLDAKITDFGTTRVVPRNARKLMTGGIGTVEFMAPEVMAHELYSKKADVYSFAIVVWQMLARDDPFGNLSFLAIPEHVLRGGRPPLPPSCPPKLSLLIRTCWNQKARLRPEFSEVCRFLQVIAGLSPEAFEATTEYFRKCGNLPPNTPVSRITEMQAGTVMLKCGRSGRPHFALFQLSDDARYIMWTSRHKESTTTRIRIEDIRELCLGQHTAVFSRSGMDNYANLSFSLICDNRTLDIVCTNASEFKTWAVGLKALLPPGARTRNASAGKITHTTVSRPSVEATLEGPKGTAVTTAAATVTEANQPPTAVPVVVMPPSASSSAPQSGTTDASARPSSHARSGSEWIPAKRRSMSVGSRPASLIGIVPRSGAFLCLPSPATAEIVRKEENKDVYVWPIGRHSKAQPVSPVLVEQLLGKRVADVACGETHYAAVTSHGELYTWGSNKGGQLGQFFTRPADAKEDVLHLPQIVPFAGARIHSVACGKHHTICLTVDGATFTWGKNSKGELGVGDDQMRSTPVRIPAFVSVAVTMVACGPHTSGVYTEGGDLYMWGHNEMCQCGLGKNHPVTTPQLLTAPFCASSPTPRQPEQPSQQQQPKISIVTLTSLKHATSTKRNAAPQSVPVVETSSQAPPLQVEDIALGAYHSAVVTSDGAVFLWGKLGDTVAGTPAEVRFPCPASAEAISCGHHHIAVITDDGKLFTWGDGHLGQLGRGPNEAFCASPKEVTGPFAKHKPVQVACSASYTAVVTSGGKLFVFGLGSSGLGEVKEESAPKLLKVFKSKVAMRVKCGPRALVTLVTQRRTPDERLAGWVPDKEAPNCMACKSPFTAVKRRHHCRRCEGVFCGACSKWKSPLLSKGFSEPVRVCLQCFSSLTGMTGKQKSLDSSTATLPSSP